MLNKSTSCVVRVEGTHPVNVITVYNFNFNEPCNHHNHQPSFSMSEGAGGRPRLVTQIFNFCFDLVTRFLFR